MKTKAADISGNAVIHMYIHILMLIR